VFGIYMVYIQMYIGCIYSLGSRCIYGYNGCMKGVYWV
jgi:hypothetical protein